MGIRRLKTSYSKLKFQLNKNHITFCLLQVSFVCFCACNLQAQFRNVLKNGDFEQYKHLPNPNFPVQLDSFNQYLSNWSVPNATSPDIYSNLFQDSHVLSGPHLLSFMGTAIPDSMRYFYLAQNGQDNHVFLGFGGIDSIDDLTYGKEYIQNNGIALSKYQKYTLKFNYAHHRRYYYLSQMNFVFTPTAVVSLPYIIKPGLLGKFQSIHP